MLQKYTYQLFIICSIFFFSIFGYEISSTFVSLYLANKGVKAIVIGSIFSLWPLFVIIFSPFAGFLSDKYGRKIFIFLGSLFYALFGVLCFFGSFYLAFILLGAGNAFLWTVGRAYVFDIAKGEKAKETGYFFGSAVIGSLLGAPIAGALVETFGFKPTSLLGGVIAGVSVLLSLFLVEKKQKRKNLLPARIFKFESFSSSKNLFLLLGSVLIISFLPVATKIFLPVLLASLGIKTFLIGILFFTSKLSLLVSQFIAPKIYEKYYEKVIMGVGCSIFSLSFFIIFFALVFPEFLVASILGGIGYGLSFLVSQTFLSKLSKSYGTYSGIFEIAVNIGQFFGAGFSAFLVEIFGIRNLFFFLCILSLFPAILFLFMKNKKSKKNSTPLKK
jgi:MFS family permease